MEGEESNVGGGEAVGGANRGSFNTAGKGEVKGKGEKESKEGGIGVRGGMLGGLINVSGGEGRERVVGSGGQAVDLGSLVDAVVVESGNTNTTCYMLATNTPPYHLITLLTHPSFQ